MPNTAESNNKTNQADLSGKRIILGVTGGIAAYKAAYIASALVQRGADVHVVMTQHATKLVGAATFWALTSNQVHTDVFEPPADGTIPHVSLPESADLMLIAPATANVIGKLANGLGDDMLSTMALAAKCPKIVAPAMNVNMYTNPIVVANMDRLRNYEFIVVEPGTGYLACGEEGAGRLADPDKILLAVEEVLTGRTKDLAGLNVLVTAGPTHEPIDPVRFISNRSSGKMGYAIAQAAAGRGAAVTLVSGPTELAPPPEVNMVYVETVREMFDRVTANISEADVFISAAAPADFTPSQISKQKVKKTKHWTLELSETQDILKEVAANKGDTIMVGFAAETEDLETNAKQKLNRKKLDLIVANDVSPGSDTFGSDTNEVTLFDRTEERVKWPRMSKSEVANAILDYVKKNFLEDVS